jgi:4-hydroxy-tetrahydrodipicolinate synthase
MLRTATLIPALVTPFTADGALDIPAFEQIAAHCLNTGCDGLLVNGTNSP